MNGPVEGKGEFRDVLLYEKASKREFVHNAGFGEIERHKLDHDLQNYYYVIRR